MKPTNLEWEDVIQFEEVKGYGQHIWRDGNHLYYVDEEGGIASQRVVYELPNELFALLDRGERSLLEISWKIKHDCWPPTEKEINKIKRGRAKERPKILIANPKNQLLFTQEELKELMPIAEKIWIESEGKLPDDYVSPLK
ncbi:hypothetical protein [Streptococcus parasanguinis]|uniref:hypothetical protein n=1 Tax=Streptococcus parasanguinis TaxID=1318 RepID=UPI002284E364|nr:hypothetical protein [Streptococcus parasanguinis]MCY7050286.1 hypothetical protein [Streptococcus parasanguinis]MDB8625003.1 hypothetical protein [Streptococcus parasanguinis]